jgi:hypothetical protein
MTSSEKPIHTGPPPGDDPRTAVAQASTHDGSAAPPAAWRRPTITRFGFDGTLNASGSANDGEGPGPSMASAGPGFSGGG